MEYQKTKSTEREEEIELEKLHQQISASFSKLPIDLIIDILSRLPIKSLKKLSVTEKPLLNLIRHPRFVIIHHIRAIGSTTNSPSLFVSKKGDDYSDDKHFLIDHEALDALVGTDIGSIETKRALKSMIKVEGLKFPWFILGSCNGLVCMGCIGSENLDPLNVFNPVTGDKMRLPDSEARSCFCNWTCGFGFDSRNNEYKVVRILKDVEGDFVAEVLTVGADACWREIPKVPYVFKREDSSVFVAGSLHWVGYKSEEEKIIVSFDMSTEQFGEMALPSGVGSKTPILHLGVFGREKLFLATRASDQRHSDVWVQEEYGNQASWTKRYFIKGDALYIQCSGGMKLMFQPNECGLMRVMKNGEILWLYNNGFGYYNTQDGSFRRVDISFKGKCNPQPANMFPVAHVESLISPRDVARLKKSFAVEMKRRYDIGEG